MKKINPAYIEAVKREVNECPYFRLLTISLENFEWGQCRIELSLSEKHLQPYRFVHGGVFASLIDAAAFWAVHTQIDDGLEMTTAELNVNYLKPATKGRMIGIGRSIKVGKMLCLGEASIEDEEGTLLAHGTATLVIMEDLEFNSKSYLPKKYLE